MDKKNVMSKYQPSIAEWFKLLGDSKTAKKIQEEDNSKHKRLLFLNEKIDLPYEKTQKFEAIELLNKTSKFSKILSEKGDKGCCIRLVPKKQHLPKLRNRGLTLNECYNKWFLKQKIEFEDYYAEICPHNPNIPWSMIIVVNKDKIFGEVISGHGFQLMHGETNGKLYFFEYDYDKWRWSEKNKDVQNYVKKAITNLIIKNPEQEQILKEWGAQTSNGYLNGYFELVVLPGEKISFNDYNVILPKHIESRSFDFVEPNFKSMIGLVACPGKYTGRIQKINGNDITNVKFTKGSILLTENLDIRFFNLLQKTGAIITEKGSILSHASILVQELKIPFIVNAKDAFKNLKNNDLVEVNANKGIIRKIENEN